MNIVITAGGTYEKIDSVRKITNNSSGRLGKIIAETFLSDHFKINTIFYVCTKQTLQPTNKKIKIVLVESATDLLNAVSNILSQYKIDLFIHSMAVSDYTVDYVTTTSLLSKNFSDSEIKNYSFEDIINNNTFVLSANEKISSNEDNLIIKLKPTPKIISYIKAISPQTILVGFKLLNCVTKKKLINAGYELLTKNNCDLVIANDLKFITKNKHKAFFITKHNSVFQVNTKTEIANSLVQFVKENKI